MDLPLALYYLMKAIQPNVSLITKPDYSLFKYPICFLPLAVHSLQPTEHFEKLVDLNISNKICPLSKICYHVTLLDDLVTLFCGLRLGEKP